MSKEAYRISSELADSALKAVELAIDLLESANEVFDEEERKHTVPSASQHEAVRWQEAVNDLDRAYEILRGVPRIQVISPNVTKIRKPNGVWEDVDAVPLPHLT
jgi:hypothetical protein